MCSKLVIAIDGPAGAGKSTVAKTLASALCLRYLDTGAMYRAVALKALRQKIEVDSEDLLVALCRDSKITFGEGAPTPVYLDNEEVTSLIRTAEIADMASSLSIHPKVRAELVGLQQEIVARGGVTLEGRDTTTVVAPNASLKVFLTASLEERARRRLQDLVDQGVKISFDEVRAQIAERDLRDSTRSESPLIVASDAITIDSERLDANGVVAEIICRLKKLNQIS